jgi:hypothetical protein
MAFRLITAPDGIIDEICSVYFMNVIVYYPLLLTLGLHDQHSGAPDNWWVAPDQEGLPNP